MVCLEVPFLHHPYSVFLHHLYAEIKVKSRELTNFCSDLSKNDGDIYKIQSLKCIRVGINRHTKEHRNIDIISDL